VRKKKSPKRGAAPNETVEVGLKVAEALVSSVPIVGGFLGALFELLSIPLSQRKQRWLDELAEVVSELRDRVSELSKPLEQNQDLLTAILVATPAAMRTQRVEKLAALRNAVRNSALNSAPHEDVQVLFLRWVDELTVSHLRILMVLNDPEASLRKSGRQMLFPGGLDSIIYHCVPELNRQRQMCEQLCRDLEVRGLVHQGIPFYTVMTPQGTLASRTTDLGKQFLRFIS
jgi:hypothetical protein